MMTDQLQLDRHLPIDFFTGYDKANLISELIGVGLNIQRIVLPSNKKYFDSSIATRNIAESLGIPIIEVSVNNFTSLSIPTSPTLLLSARFPFKIPQQVFSKYQFALNVHPTLLPKYRGRYLEPILINGDSNSGITLHLIDDDVDTGPIVHQIEFPIRTFETIVSLHRKAESYELQLIIEALERLANPDFSPALQNNELATSHFSQRTPEDSFIPSSATLSDALRIVRACNLTTHPAFTLIDGEKVIVQMFRTQKPTDEFDLL